MAIQVCKHGHTLQYGCRLCLGPDDWEVKDDMSASLAMTQKDALLVRLFDEELSPLEESEEHAISHEQFKALPDIREDMKAVKVKINQRLSELGHAPLYRL